MSFWPKHRVVPVGQTHCLSTQTPPTGQQVWPQTWPLGQQKFSVPEVWSTRQVKPLQHFWLVQLWPPLAHVAAWASPLSPAILPTPGTEASAPPKRAPASQRSAPRLVTAALASPLVNSSKERSLSVHPSSVDTFPFRSSADIDIFPFPPHQRGNVLKQEQQLEVGYPSSTRSHDLPTSYKQRLAAFPIINRSGYRSCLP